MEEHHLNYRNEGDRYNGCIHTMAKYSRCLLWKKICPKTRLRMKEAKLDVHGKKIRRRNILNNYNATINIQDSDDKDIAGPVQGTLSNWITTSQNKNNPQKKKDTITDQNADIKSTTIDNVSGTSEHKKKSLGDFKEKIRNFAKNYKEMNGVWFNIDDIETVSNL